MTSEPDNVVPMVARAGRLADALERARSREQERVRDAIAEREGLLQALSDVLLAMADELPDGEAEKFALVRSPTGERLRIDDLGYVDIHPETKAYRLVRQRRYGPQILSTEANRDAIADHVADYMADRIVEREALVQASPSPLQAASAVPTVDVPKGISPFWPALWWFVVGGVLTGTALFTYAWLSAGPPPG